MEWWNHIKVKNFIHNLNNKKIDIKYQMMNMNIHIKLHLIIHLAKIISQKFVPKRYNLFIF